MLNIETLFIIIFSICFVSLGVQLLLTHLLFKSLKNNHAVYYESIGEPTATNYISLKATEEDMVSGYVKSLKGGFFAYRMVFRGIPKHFPRKRKLRRLALSVRIMATITLISHTTLIIVGYLFYKSGL